MSFFFRNFVVQLDQFFAPLLTETCKTQFIKHKNGSEIFFIKQLL
jgi:hypothetical protein